MVQLRRRKSARVKNREEGRRHSNEYHDNPERRRGGGRRRRQAQQPPQQQDVNQDDDYGPVHGPEQQAQDEYQDEPQNHHNNQDQDVPIHGPQNLHPLVYNFLNYRKNRPRPHYQPGQGIFCGSPQNLPHGRELGTNYKCLRKGFGASSSSFIRDLDSFIRQHPQLNDQV